MLSPWQHLRFLCNFDDLNRFKRKCSSIRVIFLLLTVIIINAFIVNSGLFYSLGSGKENKNTTTTNPHQHFGVNLAGYYTRIPQLRNLEDEPPVNYYEESLKIISEAKMNLVRYQYYWESYEKNPDLFINELTTFANAADKWKVKVIYDNQQFHTSSWLDQHQGTGFPVSLFLANSLSTYQHSKNMSYFTMAKTWWTYWWNRSIKDIDGNDGWTVHVDFLKKIVGAVDKHPSTLGYEILNEPDIYNNTQWKKVGDYNTFIIQQLRKVTQKIIVFDRQLRPGPYGDVSPSPENMAKMAPSNTTNVLFKATLYGSPATTDGNNNIEYLLNKYGKAAELAKVPLYIAEFGIKNSESLSREDMDQKKVNLFVIRFKDFRLWGWSYWRWNFIDEDVPSYNLIHINGDGKLQTTKYFKYIENAICTFYSHCS
jgi:hypothetical protein